MKRLLPLFSLMTLPLHAQVTAPDANNLFALDCLARMQSTPGNLVFSPFSAWSVLTMTSGGAEGATLKEMASVLHYTAGDSTIHASAAAWTAELEKLKQIQLSTANRLWAAPDFTITPVFENLTSNTYRAGMERVPFAKNPSGARKTINDWISERTANRIQNLLTAQDVQPETKLVLTNAIYFKASWATEFQAEETLKFPFTRGDGTEVRTPMMLRKSTMPYFENTALQAVRLPYAGGETSMLVVLPAKGTELALKKSAFDEIRKGLTDLKVVLRLPRFTLDERLQMVPLLGALGMKTAFTDGADFGGISTQIPLQIGTVVHQAFVKVGEKGTEAAAATAVGMRATSAMMEEEPPKEFIANRPFYFFILHDSTGGILFAGRVDQPE